MNLIRNIKQSVRTAVLRRNGVFEDVMMDSTAFGSKRSAWTICPHNLDADSVVYSFGVGTDISFDLELINQFGLNVFAFDPTPRSIDWVKQQKIPETFHFHDFGIANNDGPVTFLAPKSETSSHFTPVPRYKGQTSEVNSVVGECKCLDTITRELNHDMIDILKLDIEGGEYSIIEDIAKNANKITQLLVEFHHMYKTIPLANTVQAIDVLRKAGFRLFHISNRTYEMSFIHQSRL